MRVIVKIGLDFLLITGAAGAIILLDNFALAILMAVMFGVFQVSWFEAMHWCVHNSLFKNKSANKWVGHFCGFMCLRPYFYYRANHLGHHRYLGDPVKDPERFEGDKTVDGSFGKRLFALVSTATLGIVNVPLRILTVGLAGSERHRSSVMPFVSTSDYRKLILECRWLILAYSLLATGLSIWASPTLLLYWVVALWVQIFCNLLFAAPEHAGIYRQASSDAEHDGEISGAEGSIKKKGLRHTAAQLAMTRLFTSNFLIRYLRWNENFHAAHHAYPGAPYYALPAIAKAFGEDFPNRHPSYLGFVLFGDRRK